MRNTLAMYLAVAAGVLLLGAGITGAATWESIRNFVTSLLGSHWALLLLFQVLVFLASLGGVAVILGGLLFGLGRVTSGKLLVTLGTGTGLIGLLLALALPGFFQGVAALALGTGSGIAGVVLSIAARMVAK
ncbi:MAG: hypothetical protein AB1305_05270 [Candidatus Hadarchaeota archaeon]